MRKEFPPKAAEAEQAESTIRRDGGGREYEEIYATAIDRKIDNLAAVHDLANVGLVAVHHQGSRQTTSIWVELAARWRGIRKLTTWPTWMVMELGSYLAKPCAGYDNAIRVGGDEGHDYEKRPAWLVSISRV